MKKGMTLIEIIVVLAIIATLMLIVSFSYRHAVNKALKVQCSQNLRVIWKALLLYVEDYQVSIPPGSDANDVYGAMNHASVKGKEGGLTNLKVYVCPATSHKPPESSGYGQKLIVTGDNGDYQNPSFTGSSIDYWIVKKQVTKGGSTFVNPSIPDMPDQNVLIMEGAASLGNPFHASGRNLIYKSGKVQFINSVDATQYPVNLWDDGTPEEDGIGDPLTVAEGYSIWATKNP